MKTIFLILILAVASFAQSQNFADYQEVSKDNVSVNFVDTTSFQIIKRGVNKGHVVFWGMSVFPTSKQVLLFSSEVDCKNQKFRVRQVIIMDGQNVFEKKELGNWVDTDIAKVYIDLACLRKRYGKN